jgi:dTDP-4-amino-4,6-dideoxygalactose transaminase
MRSHAPIPHLDLRAENRPLQNEIDRAIREVCESGQFVLGPQVDAFEQEFARYCGTRHGVGCASGSDSLLLALMALDLAPGDQVVCPAYTFFATASAITRFADIDPRTFNLDPEQARKASARCSKLRAFLPVDLFGQMADMDAFLALGEEMGVPVVADAAQSVGARDARGRRAGSLGDVACFSLYPTKNLGAFGDAGILVTDDDGLAERLRSLRVHGSGTPYHHDEVGINSRLDTVQAAVLRVKLRHLDAGNAARRRLAARYDEAFAAAGAVPGAYGPALDELELPLATPLVHPPGAGPVHHQYAIRVPAARRDPLQQALDADGIGTRIYYPVGLHQQRCFQSLGHGAGDLPETEAAARESLCLPMHPNLADEDVDRVVERTVAFLRS